MNSESIGEILKSLESEKSKIREQLNRVQAAIDALTSKSYVTKNVEEKKTATRNNGNRFIDIILDILDANGSVMDSTRLREEYTRKTDKIIEMKNFSSRLSIERKLKRIVCEKHGANYVWGHPKWQREERIDPKYFNRIL